MKNSLQDLQEAQDLAKLQAQMLRPAQNVNTDGSFDLGWGTALICSGSTSYVVAVLPKIVGADWRAWVVWLPFICAAFAPYGIPRIIKRFITWPRTGYVANPNDVKLSQLLMIMGFGLALGVCLTLPFTLAAEIRQTISRPGWGGGMRKLVMDGCKLLVCVTLVVYLGRKTIRKRQPLPGAYDATLIKGLRQTAAGKKTVRMVKLTLFMLFAGIPVLLGGVVFGLFYLGKSVTSHLKLNWPTLAVLGFVIATNAILYLMGNAVAIKRHRWKWLALVLMLLGPIGVVSLVPFPAVKPDLLPVLQLFPPQVMLFMGLVWFMSGLVTLVFFIRDNPPPAPDFA